MINCDCPRCGSRNTKALAVIHQDGTKDWTGHWNGWFYFRRSVGAHTSVTRGQSRSLAAQIARPPIPAMTQLLSGRGVPVTLIVGMVIAGTPGFFIALALLILAAVTSGMRDAGLHHQRLKEWSSTFRCSRCGTVFAVIGPDGEPASPVGHESRI